MAVTFIHKSFTPLPQALTEWIDRADRHFRDITEESDRCVWGDPSKYDRERYWYYYRWPR